jgi:ankyrin repeat protein
MTAAWKNHWHVLDELLKRGADVNKRDHKQRNVLHNLAADKLCNWGSSVIELLLRTDIAIDGPQGQDETKRTPLHWAASTGKRELCEMLLTRGANINAVEAKEKTALHLAVTHGRDDMVELLIKYGANVNARSDGKWTALHNACQQGSAKIVRTLLAVSRISQILRTIHFIPIKFKFQCIFMQASVLTTSSVLQLTWSPVSRKTQRSTLDFSTA